MQRDPRLRHAGPGGFELDPQRVARLSQGNVSQSDDGLKERWLTTVAQITEGMAVLEGDDRLPELIKGAS